MKKKNQDRSERELVNIKVPRRMLNFVDLVDRTSPEFVLAAIAKTIPRGSKLSEVSVLYKDPDGVERITSIHLDDNTDIVAHLKEMEKGST